MVVASSCLGALDAYHATHPSATIQVETVFQDGKTWPDQALLLKLLAGKCATCGWHVYRSAMILGE